MGVRLVTNDVSRLTDGPDEARRRTLLGAAGLVALLAGCSGHGNTTTETSQATTTSSSGVTATAGSVKPSVTVNDQTTDGSYVVVAEAAIDKPGWVGVHPTTSDGRMKPHTHVGHAMLPVGQHQDVRSELDSTHKKGGKLFVVLHYDDPADGKLTYPDGDPAVTVDGNLVRDSFELTVKS